MSDASGRADLELDVADLPAGPYLLVLLPPEVSLGDSGRLSSYRSRNGWLVTANITRWPRQPPNSPRVEKRRVWPVGRLAPEPAEAGGGLPESINTNMASARLPACQPTATPTLTLQPATGAIANWWLGCASGFAAEETIQVTVQLPGNEKTQF